jgi:F0F1-type ATP synthase epsilon subunit
MIEEKTESAKAIDESKKAQASDKSPKMHIKVYSPFKVYFDEEGESISGVNGTGPFDILPHHHNFMTLLTPCELVVRSRGAEQKIRISGGLMHVKADRVIVFLDI